MNNGLEARLRFAELMTRFATTADRGEAIKALHLCASDLRVGPDGETKPKGALANMLMVRQLSTHQTKHHVSQPTIISVASDRICGTVPVASYRLEDGKSSVGVSEFYAEIVPTPDDDDDEAWKIQRLRMIPFTNIQGAQGDDAAT